MSTASNEDEMSTVELTITLKVDVAAWCLEYGEVPSGVRADVQSYVNTLMRSAYPGEVTLWTVESVSAVDPAAAERVRVAWNDLRVAYPATTRASQEPDQAAWELATRALLAKTMTYSLLVGVIVPAVQAALEAGQVEPPTPGLARATVAAAPDGATT